MPPAAGGPLSQPRSHTWIGDAEREQADLRLQRAVGDGTLSLSGYDQRVQAVWQARTREELADPLRGLPNAAALRARGATSRGDAWIDRPLLQAAAVLGAGTLGAALVAALVVTLPSSTGEPEPLGASDSRAHETIMVEPGQELVELGDLGVDATVVVPPGVRVDVSALQGTGSLVCYVVCAADGPGRVVRIEGRHTGEVTISP